MKCKHCGVTIKQLWRGPMWLDDSPLFPQYCRYFGTDPDHPSQLHEPTSDPSAPLEDHLGIDDMSQR